MYSMYKCSSILQGLLHDELLVSNITFSIIIEKNSGPLLWLNWFKSPPWPALETLKKVAQDRNQYRKWINERQQRKVNIT
jgi:hypothetical protein